MGRRERWHDEKSVVVMMMMMVQWSWLLLVLWLKRKKRVGERGCDFAKGQRHCRERTAIARKKERTSQPWLAEAVRK